MNVLLTSLSAKNIHKTLVPWCLKAYCDEALLGEDISVDIAEYTVNESVYSIFDAIFMQKPDVVGFSCYIWNIENTEKVCKLIRLCLPDTILCIGGPEVSFDADENAYSWADYILVGEGEGAMADLLRAIKNDELRKNRVILPQHVPFAQLPTPYTAAFFDSFKDGVMLEIKNQLVYYETSRGCPFSCAYCLSSATDGVDFLPVERVKQEIQAFIAHGATTIKFVDRTFNAQKSRAVEILEFVRTLDTACTFHFEVAADLFSDEMLEVVRKMPIERVQFEIGIQSTNEQTLSQICRKTDTQKVLDTVKKLVRFNNCHIHVDLIAGLPSDTLETFQRAVSTCVDTGAHMLQLGFLKLLKGSALRESASDFGCVYSPFPPYEVLKTSTKSVEDIIFLESMEKVIEKFYNTGIYKNSIAYGIRLFKAPYAFFASLARYCDDVNLRISVKNSYTLLLAFLTLHGGKDEAEHFIKLDCFLFNRNTELPDSISSLRDKERERTVRYDFPRNTHLKIVSFAFDGTTRLFVYQRKHPITREFESSELSEKE